MKKYLFYAFTICTLFLTAAAQAQETTEQSPIDTLATGLNKLKSDVDVLKRIKISGYLQPQYQQIDTAAAESFAGGNFNSNSNNRFSLRRGRVKVSYETTFSQYVFQIDATEKGFAVKDMYAKFTEPYAKAFSITAGIMNRPFGYEIGYSSSMRESPERGRMSQILFPGERDLGAMITFQMPKTSVLNFLKLDAGLYNGSGSSAVDYDSRKDFIGRLGFNKSLAQEKIQLSGGLSYYSGGIYQDTITVYRMGKLTNGDDGFLASGSKKSENKAKFAFREYKGVDLQASFDFPFGITTLRGEYIFGQQPGTSSSSTSFSALPTSSTTTYSTTLSGTAYTTKATTLTSPSDFYLRKFSGAYFYFLQNIFQTKNQFILKYDWYDPNTQTSGDQIGKAGTKTSKADIKYTTLGIGWAYRWDSNVKITAYYDMVSNETSKNLKGTNGTNDFRKDLKDNVFTIRLQYKF